MIRLHVIVAVVLVSRVQAIQIPESANRTEQFIYLRCKNNTDYDTTTLINSRLKEFYPFYNLSTVDIQNFCPATKNTLLELVKKLSLEITPCFVNPDEKYFPQFLYRGLSEFMEFLCANRTFEIFFSPQGVDCRDAMNRHELGKEQIASCSKQLFQIFNDIVTYKDLCGELKRAEKCYSGAISNTCRHFGAYESLNRDFFKAIGVLCGAAEYCAINIWSLVFGIVLSLSL